MDAATKQFLEQMQATLEDGITSWRNASIAHHEVLVQKLELQATPAAAHSTPAAVTTDGVVGPVPASSSTANLVTAAVVVTDVPVLAASAASAKPLDIDATGVVPPMPTTRSMKCPSHDTTESMPVSTPAAAPTSPSATVDVIPMLATAAASNGTLSRELIKAAASTRPWLEPVPPHPPDPWSLSSGAWSGSRPKACTTVQSAVNTALLCNDTEEVPTYVLSDEVPQHDEVQRQPWPPPPEFCENSLCEELKEIFGNAASFGLQHCSSNCPRGTTLATLESQMLQLLDLLEGANQLKCTKRAQGFTGELLVEAGIRQNIEVKQSDTSTRGLFLDHHSRLGFVILGVLVTCFSRVQILTLAFKKTSFQIDPMSLQEFIGTSYCYLHFGAAQNLGTLVCCAWAVLRLLSGAARCDLFHGEWVPDSSGPAYTNATCRFSEVPQNCMSNGRPDDGYLYWKWKTYGYDMLPPFYDKTFLDDFWLTWDPGWTSHCIIIFCCHERNDNCSLLWARWFTWYQWYNSSSTWTCFGVGLFNAILLQNWLLSWFIGQNTQWGFELLQLKTAHSHQWKCPAIASAYLKEHQLPDVGEVILQANFIIVCSGATTFRPTLASALLDTMKGNNSKPSSRTLCNSTLGTTICALQDASSTMLVFIGICGGGQEKFQGGRHMPGLDRHIVLQLPWDPGEEFNQNLLRAQVFCESGSELPLHFEQVPVDHNYYLISVHKTKEVHIPWDPGKATLRYPSKASAWGQAEFQGGGDVRTLSWVTGVGLPSRTSTDGPSPVSSFATNRRKEATEGSIQKDQANRHGTVG